MKAIIAILALSLLTVACKEDIKPEVPVVTPPPVVIQPEPIPTACQKEGNFVVCDSADVGNCKYHNNINELINKAKAQGYKKCITYRGTEVLAGEGPCLPCKKPGFND